VSDIDSPWSRVPADLEVLKENPIPVINAPRGEDAQVEIKVFDNLDDLIKGLRITNIRDIEHERFKTGVASALAITGWVVAALVWVF
jgi:hypothetical protein